ncbi:MAG: GAF domain-containing sensor histidine kinase, partial [Candidatus Eisenbacteria bacterium]
MSAPRVTLVEQELVRSVDWLISLRWLAGAAVVLMAPLAASVLGAPLPAARLTGTGFAILGYNAGLYFILWWLRRRRPGDARMFEHFTRLQIALDWITTAELMSLTGGAESPVAVFFLFHIAIASLLLPHRLGFFYVGLAPALVATVAALEYFGLRPHVAILQPPRHHDLVFVLASVGFFSIACWVLAYCCMSIAVRLRRRETELGMLYDGVRDIASSLELDVVLERICEAGARVLGCRAAAIRLLDTAGAQVEFAASFGLSRDYREEVPGEMARSRLDRDTLLDGVTHVRDTSNDERVWHPDRVREEGIASMLSVVIPGRSGPLGVLRAYGGTGHRFGDEDVEFLQAVAAQGGVAIEHAKAYRILADLDRDKSRFLRMTTHELRSPVRVTESLLMTLRDGYAGELSPTQHELLERAQKRLHSLHALVDDLLSLAAGKAELSAPQPRALDLAAAVRDASERFRTVADEKGVALAVRVPTEPLSFECDPVDLDRIVTNVVGNAVKYTR